MPFGARVSFVMLACAACGQGVVTAGAPASSLSEREGILEETASAVSADLRTVTYGGLSISLDRGNGTIRRITHPTLGTILDAAHGSSQLFTLGYPAPPARFGHTASGFIALNLSASLSEVSRWEASRATGLTLTWDRLRPSREGILPTADAAVSATVNIRGAGNGKSLVMRCTVENSSPIQISQVLFPDLAGLRPIHPAGDRYGTWFRIEGREVPQFVGPVTPEDRTPFYAMELWQRVPFKGLGRWVLFENWPRGGLRVDEAASPAARSSELMARRDEDEPDSLRLVWRHPNRIDPGESWSSGDFWLTPVVKATGVAP